MSAKIYYTALLISVVIIISLACYGVFFQPDKIKQEVAKLYLNGKFTIGTIISKGHTTYELGVIMTSINYTFLVQNSKQKGFITRPMAKHISKATYNLFLKSGGIKPGVTEGDQFLVLYDENDLESSIILFECPITSEDDFERYKAEIEELRKDPKWHGYE